MVAIKYRVQAVAMRCRAHEINSGGVRYRRVTTECRIEGVTMDCRLQGVNHGV